MRYVLLIVGALVAFDVTPARADTISLAVNNATMFMSPNVGGGDHIFFRFTGTGVKIEGIGGMACFEWCTGGPIPPGTPISLTQIFISNFTSAVLGGVGYDPNSEIGLSGSSSFFNDAGGLSQSVLGFVGQGPTFNEFVISMPGGGSWTLNFTPATDEQGIDTQAFVNGTFAAGTATPAPTPEPATLGLIALGSTGIWISARRRRSATPDAATPASSKIAEG